MRKRIPNGENNLSNNSLMLKLSFLEKQFDNMKIRQDELEKLSNSRFSVEIHEVKKEIYEILKNE